MGTISDIHSQEAQSKKYLIPGRLRTLQSGLATVPPQSINPQLDIMFPSTLIIIPSSSKGLVPSGAVLFTHMGKTSPALNSFIICLLLIGLNSIP